MEAKTMLSSENIDSFIPMQYRLTTGRNGRKKRELVPVLKNLIFVHTDLSRIKKIKVKAQYLQYIMGLDADGKKMPIIVPDDQMNAFIAVSNSFDKHLIYLKPDEIDLAKGQKVRIHGGFFDDMEGRFLKIEGKRNRRVVIAVQGVIAVAVVVEHFSFIEVLEQ